MPLVNLIPRITFGKWWCPSSRRQLFSAAWASLKIRASAVLFDRQPFERTVRWRIVANVLSIGFLHALAHAIGQAHDLLLAFRRRADDDQKALGVRFKAGLHMDAVDPEVDVAFGREIALRPPGMLVRPGVLQSGDARGG